MKYIIDRFEGDFAILELELELIQVLKNTLPENSTEGDLLEWTESGWKLCPDETKSRKQELIERRHRMLGDFP
ncbi:MAG: DUF3006 domain-containing protein [Oscillospiraceae bacterium]|nr:DUF3006 domain-containing protein [Ruminococcus sp.]MDE6707405.1 DUF3006 domain-containing protein [Oscillospiraceae bacterium]